MDNEKRRLMRKIQDLSFAKDEAILFLDTHPDCTDAMEYYRQTVKELDEVMTEYQNRFDPIYHEASISGSWRWCEGLWPWQTEGGNK